MNKSPLSTMVQTHHCTLIMVMVGFVVATSGTTDKSQEEWKLSNGYKVIPKDMFKDHKNRDLLPKDCGQRTEAVERTLKVKYAFKIVGGKEAKIVAHPWMALLRFNKTGDQEWGCGASIINQRYVLTAAHCVVFDDMSNMPISIRFGEHTISTSRDCKNSTANRRKGRLCNDIPVDINIETIVAHPEYQRGLVQNINDIALLRLNASLNWTDFIQPVCLPFNINMTESIVKDNPVQVTGWGYTDSEGNVKADVLQEVCMLVKSDEECQKIIDTMSFDSGEKLEKDILFCAGAEGKDACQGDSGSALLLPPPPSAEGLPFMQLGIVSSGPKRCGRNHLASLYTKISVFLEWILDNIEP